MKLKAFFFLALAVLLIHMSWHAHASTRLNNCSFLGTPTHSTLFISCINQNFNTIKRASGLDVVSCFNYGEGQSFSFQLCSNKNFRHLSDRLKLKLDSCPNLGEELTPMYIACIKKNFDAIERALP